MGHSSLGALARRSLGVEVGHSSLGALVAAVVGHLAPVAGHLWPVVVVGHLEVVMGHLEIVSTVVGHLAPVVAVGHSSSVAAVDFVDHQASNSVPECPSDHWDWLVAADTRYYSQLDLPSIAWVDTACWGLGQHTVLAHRWVADCQVDWDPVVAEYHSMVADYWVTTGWHQREEGFRHLDLRQVVGAPALRCALLLGVILD